MTWECNFARSFALFCHKAHLVCKQLGRYWALLGVLLEAIFDQLLEGFAVVVVGRIIRV